MPAGGLSLAILWIEDQPEEYYPLIERLRRLPWVERVETAQTEKEAQWKLVGQHFGLVILDVMLPPDEDALNAERVSLNAGRRLLTE